MPLTRFAFHPVITFIRRAQLVLAIAIYLYAALASGPDTPSSYPDWLLHFIGNACLFGSVWVATLKQFSIRAQLLTTIPFSVVIELGQMFSLGRQVDPKDMLVNFVGLLTAAAICITIEKYGLTQNTGQSKDKK